MWLHIVPYNCHWAKYQWQDFEKEFEAFFESLLICTRRIFTFFNGSFSAPFSFFSSFPHENNSSDKNTDGKIDPGPLWWSSGQLSRLLFWRYEFESRRNLQFFCKICVWKGRKYTKQRPGWPFNLRFNLLCSVIRSNRSANWC